MKILGNVLIILGLVAEVVGVLLFIYGGSSSNSFDLAYVIVGGYVILGSMISLSIGSLIRLFK